LSLRALMAKKYFSEQTHYSIIKKLALLLYRI
jgi:hypothetical protein